MDSAFEIIAEPNRRAILGLLAASEQSVGEIERRLRMPQPTVSKHLRVLRDAGFVEATVDAQRRLYRLKPRRFQELDSWLAQFRRFCLLTLTRSNGISIVWTWQRKPKPKKRKSRDPSREPNRGEEE